MINPRYGLGAPIIPSRIIMRPPIIIPLIMPSPPMNGIISIMSLMVIRDIIVWCSSLGFIAASLLRCASVNSAFILSDVS